jgi:hypothetical protein
MTEAIQNLQTLVAAQSTKIAELETTISTLKPRDRGPQSTRVMTDEDAKRVKFGDLKSATHKAAAEATGLSYGQIYSCREGYTFKHIKETATAA